MGLIRSVSICQQKRPDVKDNDLCPFPIKIGIGDSFGLQLLRVERYVAHLCSMATIPFDDPEIAGLFVQCCASDQSIGFRRRVILETPDPVASEVHTNGGAIGADVVARKAPCRIDELDRDDKRMAIDYWRPQTEEQSLADGIPRECFDV